MSSSISLIKSLQCRGTDHSQEKHKRKYTGQCSNRKHRADPPNLCHVVSDLVALSFHAYAIYNSHNHRNHSPIGNLQRLARAVALAIDQHRIADSRLRVIQRDEVVFRRDTVPVHDQRLNDQQPAILIMRVADGGNDCANNFSDDQQNLFYYVILSPEGEESRRRVGDSSVAKRAPSE